MPAPEVVRPPVLLSGEAGIITGERPRSTELIVPATPVAAWNVAKRVYQAIDIPVTVENPAGHQLGNNSFAKTRTLGGMRMSELVDCGSGMTGRKADTYRILMSLMTVIDPDPKGVRLRTMLVAYGQDMGGDSTERIACGTTGLLELTVNNSIRDNLPKP